MAEVAEWIVDACNGYKRNNDFVKFKCGNRVVDAQVLCVDCNDDRPVLIRYRDDNKWSFYSLPGNGKNETCALLPSLFEGWINVYPSQGSLAQLHSTKESAKRAAGDDAIRVGVHMREVPNE